MRAKSLHLFVSATLVLSLANCTDRQKTVGPEPVSRGVVMEEVGEGSALEKAGLRPGDVVWAWERFPNPPANPEADRGEIESVFDWMWLKVEQAPRGTVKLVGERAGKERFFEVEMGKWKGRARPNLSDLALEAYLRGHNEIKSGEIHEGVETWCQLSQLEEAKGSMGRWIRLRIGEEYAEKRAWETAHDGYLAAVTGGGARAEVAIWELMGKLYERRRVWDPAEANYQSALEVAEATWKESLHAAHLRYRLGGVAYLRGQFERASNYYQDALETQSKLAPGSVASAKSLGNLGIVAVNRGQLELASEYFQSDLEIQEKLAPDSLDLAQTLGNLGTVAQARGQVELASEYHQRALEIQERLAPNSPDLAKSLGNLGIVAQTRGRLELASEYHQRALEIQKRQSPESLDLAKSLSNLGIVAQTRGQLELASEYHRRALEIQERLAPESPDLAKSLGNLGTVAQARGQLELASEYHQRSLEIQKRQSPESPDLAKSLSNLGTVAQTRGQLELASEYHQRALEIQEKQAPESLDLAKSLGNLGGLAHDRGQLELASEYFKRAFEIKERLAPDSVDLAMILNGLGLVARDRGQLELASEYHQRERAIKEKLAPESLTLAWSLNGLGLVAHARGQLELARSYHQHALEIREKLAPDSLDLIASLHHLGQTARDRGDLGRAADLFQRAVDALEARISDLATSHGIQASIRARHGEYYRDAIESLLRLHRPEAAFATLESSRGRAFLALLTERDLIFSDVPEDLDRERRRLAVLYDRTQEQLKGLNPRDHGKRIGRLTSQLREIRRQHDANTEEIRRADPAFAALRYPEPLDLAGVRQALDPKTVMLSYSVGRGQTDLFVLTREGPLQVHSLALGEKILKSQLEKFNRQVSTDRHAQGSFRMARWFYREIVEPASDTIEKSDRVLIVPDGPLHRLPFAALIRDRSGDEERHWQYLIEWKPLHQALSGTVYAELRKLRRPLVETEPSSVALAAFGDPDYSLAHTEDGGHHVIEDVYVRDVAERHDFKPLPYTRTEVEAIAAFFGSQSVRTYLGEDATEERAKALGKDVRIVHFAAHGYLNDAEPLNTALALTIPEPFSEGRENGLLQVWEIFERVRLDADLVVLSACRSAAGEEQFGEGLIGLSRAFQYAGARSVLATLWSVPDRTTAELMTRFYRHLRSGQAFDESLRAAQMELIRGEVKTGLGHPASEPFHWASFQVIGDWK